MQFSTIISVALLAVAPVIARNCTPGLKYCGATLNDIGDYDGQIEQALRGSKQPIANGDNSLFHCDGGSDGLITYLKYCGNGCQDNGGGNSDSCA